MKLGTLILDTVGNGLKIRGNLDRSVAAGRGGGFFNIAAIQTIYSWENEAKLTQYSVELSF